MEIHPNDEVPTCARPRESSDSVGESRLATGLIPIILFGFLVIFFWPILTPDSEHRSHIGQDLLTKDYPSRLFAMRELLRGRIPLWDEHLFGGWPGLANSEMALFYPPNVLLMPFWTERGFSYLVFQWWILLHLFFAGLGTALLGRKYGLSVAGALLAGTVMMFSGFLVAHKIHSNLIQTVVWLPWVLLCLEAFIRRGCRVPLWLCAGCLICAYSGGHPQMTLYLTLVVLLRLLWEILAAGADGRHRAIRCSIPPLFAILVAILTTTVQWLPARDLVAQGERFSPTYQSSAEYSLPLEELVDTVLPEPTKIPGFDPGIEVFYWGVVTIFLALLCFPVVRLRGPAGFFVAAGVVALILALGGGTAAHRWAFDFVPGIAWLRAGSRWMVVVTLAVALAAGRGLDAVTRDRIFASPRIARVYAILTGAFFFCMLFLFFQRLFVPEEALNETSPLLQQLAWILLCLALVAGTFALHALGKLPAAVLAAVMVLLIFWDLSTVHGSREIEEGAEGFAWDEAVETILDDPTPGRVKIRFGRFDRFGRFYYDRRQYSGQVFGFRELDGESPLKPRAYTAQRPLTSLEDPPRINHRYLDLCSTEYLLTDIPNPGGPWQRISENFWHNPDVSPGVRWYGSYLAVDPAVIPWFLASQSIPYDRVALVGTDRFPPQEWGPRSLPGTSVTVDTPLVVLSVSAEGIRHQAAVIINGSNFVKNATGYNIVVIDPDNGKVTASDCFNTMADYKPDFGVLPAAPENVRMARFIDEIPNGHIVIAAVREEGTNILQAETVMALQSCGSGVDLRKQLRIAHAMVGVKGMPPGTALEVVGATEALLMTDVDGSWLRFPTPAESPADVAFESAHLNAQRIWEELQEFPISLPPSASYRICDGTALLRLPIVVFSSPKDDDLPPDEHNDRAGLIIGAKDWSPNQRGYNLAALDALTGEVLATGSFDTGLDWDAVAGEVVPGTPENSRMIRFLEILPTGAIVLGAVRDEGCNILQPETVAALRTVGCELDLRKKFRWAHAFAGVKGATPGSAVEIASSTHVIIHTVVRNSPVPQLNTSLPVLDPWRHVELSAQGIPILMSRAAKNLSNEQVGEVSAEVVVAAETVESATPSFPRIFETDLRERDSHAEWSMLKRSPEEFEIVGSATGEGILFMSEPFFPDWEAYLDGERVEIIPVFRFFRGVRVPLGNHMLRVVYRPASVFRGAVLSCLGLLMWVGWGVWSLSSRGARRKKSCRVEDRCAGQNETLSGQGRRF